MSNENWDQWGRSVLSKRLDSIDEAIKDCRKDVQQAREDISALKVKSGVWGLVAGAVPVVILVAIQYLMRKS